MKIAARAGLPAAAAQTPAAKPAKTANFRLSFKIQDRELYADGSVLVADGSEGEYARQGETPDEAVKTERPEYGKHAVSAKCAPVSIDERTTTVVVEKGRSFVMVDEPERLVEVKLEELGR